MNGNLPDELNVRRVGEIGGEDGGAVEDGVALITLGELVGLELPLVG